MTAIYGNLGLWCKAILEGYGRGVHSHGMAIKRKIGLVLVTAVLLIGGLATFAIAGNLPTVQLDIKTTKGIHTFQVEIAASKQDRRIGLMFRKSLGEKEGMLFVYETAAPIAMWMKDTYISLDMLFINQQGYIVKIAENTKPKSLKPISSDYPVTMVLEVPGGTVKELGIQISDQISYQDAQ
jgi:uncharacterized protein